MAEYRLNQQGQQVQTAIDKALALGPATSSSAGTMSAADKSKLDSMNPSNYQPVLVSGTNIKTVNNQSILGSGNIDVQGGGSITVDSSLSTTSTNPVQNKVITTALGGKQATLVGSGTGQNIKTINNQNILGTGNIDAGSLVTIDSALSTTSTNPVQNKVINTALGGKQDTISDLATIRSGAAAGATAVQPSALSAKQDVLVSGTNIKTINNESILGSGNITIQGGGGSGSVTSVAMTVPTGLSVSGSPITTSGTLAVSLASGYKIPTTSELSDLAPKASPAFTGTPTAPTATAGTNTTQIATTAFVQAAVSSSGGGTVTSVGLTVPTGLSVSGSPITSSGTLAISLGSGYKIPTTTELSALAPKASPQFTGTPSAPTAASGTNTTQIATTAFVQNAFSNTVFLGDVIETI